MRGFKELLILCVLVATAVKGEPKESKGRFHGTVKFYVYTRQNPEVPEALEADVESIVRNIINPAKPTTLAIHNMLGNQYAEEYSIIKDTKLNLEDGNVIIVDYSALIDAEDYEATFELAPYIAESIADLIVILQYYFDMDLRLLHVVGFSVGGQIAGLVGQQVSQRCGENVPRITALDPAGVLFNDSTPVNERLSADDADFVEVIHTNAGNFGFLTPCGHVDYYPNGGKIQPGCSDNDAQCSHVRAYQLIPEMWLPIENQELLVLKCSGIEYLGADYCRWLSQKMGDFHQQNEEGVYYLETNAAKPFGKGAFKAQFL